MWTQGFACSRATLQPDDLSEVRHHNDKGLTVFERRDNYARWRWNRTGWTGFNDRTRSRLLLSPSLNKEEELNMCSRSQAENLEDTLNGIRKRIEVIEAKTKKE